MSIVVANNNFGWLSCFQKEKQNIRKEIGMVFQGGAIQPSILFVSLIMNIDNGFPLDTKLDLFLRDSISNLNLDTLEIANFSSGIIDQDGYLIDSFFSVNQLDLSQEEIINFAKSNQLVLDVTLNTDENQSIRLYSDYEFLVNIGMRIKLDFDE